MDIDFEESDCQDMPDLNLAGSAVQAYMHLENKSVLFASKFYQIYILLS